MTNEIIYVGDPMCSWCWGFAPVINLIQNDFHDEAPLSIILGGLHAYDDFPMDSDYKNDIRNHWEDVNKATGAVFDYSFFDRRAFILDTEPACRAVVAIRQINPAVALTFYESISCSFYSENKDTTDVDTFKPLVENVGINFAEFATKFHAHEIKEETKSDFTFSKKVGVTGFPTVLVKEDDKLALLTAGYQPYQNLKPVILDWLKNGLPEHPEK
jgi:putative protein-disulfide isomerase